jgi:hypothetical protein
MKTSSKPIAFVEGSLSISGNEPDALTSLCCVEENSQIKIAVGCSKGPNRLYALDPFTSIWKNIADDTFADRDSATQIIASGHFLGNHEAVFYFLNSDQEEGYKYHQDKILFFDQEKQSYQSLSSSSQTLLNQFVGISAHPIDLEGTGQHGFLIGNYGAPHLFFYYSQTHKKIAELSKQLCLNQTSYAQVLSSGLFSKKPYVELLIGNGETSPYYYGQASSQQNSFFFHQQDLLKQISSQLDNTKGLTPIDLTGNGLADFIMIALDSCIRILVQQSSGKFLDYTPPFLEEKEDVLHVVSGDFDNDGYEEVFFHCEESDNFMLRYLGDFEWEDVPLLNPILKTCHGLSCIVGDLNQDGSLDLCMTHGFDEERILKIFYGCPNENFWLRVKPLTAKGSFAYGAKIHLILKDGTNIIQKTRFIQSGGTAFSQSESFAHFGLGAKPHCVDLIIQWPHSINNEANPPILHLKNIKEFNRILTIPFQTSD